MEFDVNFLKLARQAGVASTMHFVDPIQIKAVWPVVQNEGFFVSLFELLLEYWSSTLTLKTLN